MEGSNGNGPAEGPAAEAAAPAQTVQIIIEAEILRRSKQTKAVRTDDGGLVIEFLVRRGGGFEIHRYVIGEDGKKAVLEAAMGGIQMPGAIETPADLRGD